MVGCNAEIFKLILVFCSLQWKDHCKVSAMTGYNSVFSMAHWKYILEGNMQALQLLYWAKANVFSTCELPTHINWLTSEKVSAMCCSTKKTRI